ITFARHFHQPVHLQLGKHWRLEPGLLVVRELVMRRDLGGSGPAVHLFKGHGTENASVFVLAQEPVRIRVHYSLGRDALGEGEGIAPGGPGITRVWPICSFRSFSMWLNFCSSSIPTL